MKMKVKELGRSLFEQNDNIVRVGGDVIVWLQEVRKDKNRFLPIEGAMPIGIDLRKRILIGRARGKEYGEERYPRRVREITTGKKRIVTSVYVRSGFKGLPSFPIKKLNMVGSDEMSMDQVEIYLKKRREESVVIIKNAGNGIIGVYDRNGKKVGNICYGKGMIVDETPLYLELPGAYFLMEHSTYLVREMRGFLKIYF
jgi:hypothetical protein